MIRRVRDPSPHEVRRFLYGHYRQNVYLLADLAGQRSRLPGSATLECTAYRLAGECVAALGAYSDGRVFVHWSNHHAVPLMIRDIVRRRARWVMGAWRELAPLVEGMVAAGAIIELDEDDDVCSLRLRDIHVSPRPDVRQALARDIPQIAALRKAFECEYFGVPPSHVDEGWCRRAAQRYVAGGAFVAEGRGKIVAMAAVEAAIPQIAHVGGVFTVRSWRNRGLARAVVSALCDYLRWTHPEASLTVRRDNRPARRAYASLGFRPLLRYRMVRLRALG